MLEIYRTFVSFFFFFFLNKPSLITSVVKTTHFLEGLSNALVHVTGKQAASIIIHA